MYLLLPLSFQNDNFEITSVRIPHPNYFFKSLFYVLLWLPEVASSCPVGFCHYSAAGYCHYPGAGYCHYPAPLKGPGAVTQHRVNR